MPNKVETILEEIKGLTLLEAADLVKKMEETFGVSAAAAAPVMMAGGGAAGGAGPGRGKNAISAVVPPRGANKNKFINAGRVVTHLGLEEGNDPASHAAQPVQK